MNANDYNSKFHKAVREFGGLDNFDFEIIHLVSPEEYTYEILNNLEKYYIKLYNSY